MGGRKERDGWAEGWVGGGMGGEVRTRGKRDDVDYWYLIQ
jgi:hypothetical protein